MIKYSHSLQNSYLLSQTSRRFLLAAGFRLNQIVCRFLSVLILYFPRSLKSLLRKLHQQRRTMHRAKIDRRKKPFLLNSSCRRSWTAHSQIQLLKTILIRKTCVSNSRLVLVLLVICFGLRKWREFSKPITKHSKRNTKVNAFDTQVKTALFQFPLHR